MLGIMLDMTIICSCWSCGQVQLCDCGYTGYDCTLITSLYKYIPAGSTTTALMRLPIWRGVMECWLVVISCSTATRWWLTLLLLWELSPLLLLCMWRADWLLILRLAWHWVAGVRRLYLRRGLLSGFTCSRCLLLSTAITGIIGKL